MLASPSSARNLQPHPQPMINDEATALAKCYLLLRELGRKASSKQQEEAKQTPEPTARTEAK